MNNFDKGLQYSIGEVSHIFFFLEEDQYLQENLRCKSDFEEYELSDDGFTLFFE